MMLKADNELIAELRIVLTKQRYSPVVIGNYCAYARGFVEYRRPDEAATRLCFQ